MLRKPIDTTDLGQLCTNSLVSFKKILTACTREKMQAHLALMHGQNFFHFLMDREDVPLTREKIKFLFTQAKRLGLNPNERYRTKGLKNLPAHCAWDNSPLSHCISYEIFGLIPLFLECAKKEGFEIDLNTRDKEGKTPFIFALKIGWAPIEIISLLVTPENYNLPDKSGMTPMMVACAMRRIDVAKLLIQYEAKKQNLGSINFSALTAKQQTGLSDFILQSHPESGKTLGHYAVLRAGTLPDQKKELSYQDTVLNILKSAGVDGLRDENARWNSIVSPTRQGIPLQEDDGGIPTGISHIQLNDYSNQVYLSARVNEKAIMNLPIEDLHPYFKELFAGFSGISYVDSILSRSQAMIDFLHLVNVDLAKKQKNGKTPADYINGLITSPDRSLIAKSDQQYLFKLKEVILSYVEQGKEAKKEEGVILNSLDQGEEPKKAEYVSLFFRSEQNFKPEVTELIIDYCGIRK